MMSSIQPMPKPLLLKRLIALLFLVLISTKLFAEQAFYDDDRATILFIYPVDKGFPFWDSQVNFAEAVAAALHFNLDVAYTPKSYRNRFDAAHFVRQLIDSKSYKPSLIVTSFWVGSEESILTMLDAEKIPLISINSDLSAAQFTDLGKPRQRFPLWLAHFSPNDTKAGNQLATAINEESRRRRCLGKSCEVNIFAITGLSYSAVSKQRSTGLKKAVHADIKANLLNIIYGNWERTLVASKAKTIVQRHSDINAYWIASDVMAYGLLEGLKSAQFNLPENTIIGGIDWSPETIEKIRRGEMDISLGGHFMEAGWGLILFYDYLNKVELPVSTTTIIKTEMSLLNIQNINELGPFLIAPKWSTERIRSYSKFLNPKLKQYNHDPRSVILEQL